MTSNAVDRTSEVPLSEWVRDPAFHGWDPDRTALVDSGLLHQGSPNAIDVPTLVASGICAADVEAYRQLGGGDPVLSARYLFSLLANAAQDIPDMRLRDAVGYAFVARRAQGGAELHVGLYRRYAAVGQGPSGWLLAAAGISWDEVSDHGAPDPDALATLAVLRGWALPR